MFLKATAYHLGAAISISSVIKEFDFELVKTENEYVFFQLNQTSWIYIKNYGSVVFVNVDTELRNKLINFLTESDILDDLPNEEFEIEIAAGLPIRVRHGLVQLPEISMDIAHVFCLNLAQSVALDHYRIQVEKLLEITTDYSIVLSKKGSLVASQKKINKITGEVMIQKNRIAENLYIFESPDIVWDEGDLSAIDEQLRRDLNIERRHQGIQFHLDVVKENLDNYMSILQHKHSSMLEWVIIILIAIEIIHLFII